MTCLFASFLSVIQCSAIQINLWNIIVYVALLKCLYNLANRGPS